MWATAGEICHEQHTSVSLGSSTLWMGILGGSSPFFPNLMRGRWEWSRTISMNFEPKDFFASVKVCTQQGRVSRHAGSCAHTIITVTVALW